MVALNVGDTVRIATFSSSWTDDRGTIIELMPEAEERFSILVDVENGPHGERREPTAFGPGDLEFVAKATNAERIRCVLRHLERFGQADSAAHLTWTIDQTVRILTGDDYPRWVLNFRHGDDGPETYSWDEGIAP